MGQLAELPGVHIAANVPDVRPYLAEATLSIAPLQIARGVQNKVLEAMAMAKCVIASPQAIEGLDLTPNENICQAARPTSGSRPSSASRVHPNCACRLARRQRYVEQQPSLGHLPEAAGAGAEPADRNEPDLACLTENA